MSILSEGTDSSQRPSQDSGTVEMSGTDSDIMIVDEVPARTRMKDEVKKKKKTVKYRVVLSRPVSQDASTVQQTHKEPLPSDGSSTQQSASSKKVKKADIIRTKSKAEKRDLLAHPDRIVANILSKSTFKVPNLSERVEAHFKSAQFSEDVSRALENVSYDDKTLDANMSILPLKFNNYTVNLSPCAITYLPDMYEIPQRRKRQGSQNGNHKRHKGNNPGGQQNQQRKPPQQSNQQQRPPQPSLDQNPHRQETQQKPTHPKQNPLHPKQNRMQPKQSSTLPKQNPVHTKQNPTFSKQNSMQPKQNSSQPKQNPTQSKQSPTRPKQEQPQAQIDGQPQQQQKCSKKKKKKQRQSQPEGQEQRDYEFQQQLLKKKKLIRILKKHTKYLEQQLELEQQEQLAHSNHNGKAQSRSRQRQEQSPTLNSCHRDTSSTNDKAKSRSVSSSRARSRNRRERDLRSEVLGSHNEDLRQKMSRKARNKTKKKQALVGA